MTSCWTYTCSNCQQRPSEEDNSNWKPKAVVLTDTTESWFTSVPVGCNVLGQVMKTTTAGKLDKTVTNHCLHLYVVLKMFGTNIPEKLIMKRSGHIFLEEVRQYDKTMPARGGSLYCAGRLPVVWPAFCDTSKSHSVQTATACIRQTNAPFPTAPFNYIHFHCHEATTRTFETPTCRNSGCCACCLCT